jgi:hypothetical protein
MRAPEGTFPTLAGGFMRSKTIPQMVLMMPNANENVKVAINATISSKNYGPMAGQSMNLS